MKAKLQAGVELDILSPEEFRDGMRGAFQDWVTQSMIGPKRIDIFGVGTVDSAGNLAIGGENADLNQGNMGPDNGMVWSIKWLSTSGLKAGDTLSIYRGSNTASRFVRSDLSGYQSYGSDQLVLRGGIRLLITGATLATPANTVVTVTGQAWELPQTMLYRLL